MGKFIPDRYNYWFSKREDFIKTNTDTYNFHLITIRNVELIENEWNVWIKILACYGDLC